MWREFFTDQQAELFSKYAMLSDEEIFLLKSRCRGYTVQQQAFYLHKSTATIHRMLSAIKKKYDIVQQHYPDDFPKRKKSTKIEKFLDEN